ncbi:hypothetical protein AUI51_01580 [archaeon 13_1_40CM_2_52_4]|nr:MAG: hypothetical protein AUI51_01580 [archaeon 13_1_40CM_2_52_4]
MAQKIVALIGVFVLGVAAFLALERLPRDPGNLGPPTHRDFWDRPVTSLGFVAIVLGVVLGLAQYWYAIVFAGFILLVAGVMLYLLGMLTEKTYTAPTGNESTS